MPAAADKAGAPKNKKGVALPPKPSLYTEDEWALAHSVPRLLELLSVPEKAVPGGSKEKPLATKQAVCVCAADLGAAPVALPLGLAHSYPGCVSAAGCTVAVAAAEQSAGCKGGSPQVKGSRGAALAAVCACQQPCKQVACTPSSNTVTVADAKSSRKNAAQQPSVGRCHIMHALPPYACLLHCR